MTHMNRKKILKQLIIISCYLILGFGFILFLFAYVLNGTLPGIGAAIIFSGISSYLIFIYIIPTSIILKYHLKGNLKLSVIILGICGFLTFSSVLPVISTPSTIWDAESQFSELYGEQYTDLDTQNMLKEPFSLWKQFNVLPSVDSEIDLKINQEYYDNGIDKFYFDCYSPKSGTGPFPVIVNIHGGAWFLGNKGPINNIAFSKYLASQGYVVFDIQYGLVDIDDAAEDADLVSVSELVQSLFPSDPELQNKFLPKYNQSYLIPDQVENIGRFTKYLGNNHIKLNVDINNVFVMGRSAGSHLAGVVGVGYYNPKFTGVFDPKIKIKGTILYYPPTDLKRMRDAIADGSLAGVPSLAPAFNKFINDGTMNPDELDDLYEKYSPAYLIQDNNEVAPIIVIHGSLDGIVPYQAQGVDFNNIAEEFNRDCIFITIPFAGHAFDIFSAQDAGWQISSYYIERFIALEVD